jgi:ATP/maltotriose-dependent transcriptional regulator MalT
MRRSFPQETVWPLATAVVIPQCRLPVISDVLSPREIDVLSILGRGMSVKSVARDLSISPGTVKWHLHNAYGKLHAKSREEALNTARAMNIID